MLKTPRYYLPLSSFTADAKLTKTSEVGGTNGTAHLGRLTVGDHSTDRVIIFNTAALNDLVKIEFRAMDKWFEEEVETFCHPKDPYKRIEILPSTRSVRVAVDGVTIAETTSALFLLETTLRTRYYLPPTSVKWEYLTSNDQESLCPYKGKANYYDVTVNGRTYRNLVWYYRTPTMESAPIAGHFCFYNEKVDIWVDGKREER
jgi:uncharacterized protein (DUF427 family)